VRFVALFGLLFPLVELYIAGVVVLRVDWLLIELLELDELASLLLVGVRIIY
jgi:hypothetical protein